MVIAHKGFITGNIQGNTLAAFDNAFRVGADGVECDLRLTRDKKVIVAHDNKFLVLGKKFLIPKLSLKEIKSLYTQNNQEVLTIEDLFVYINSTKKSFFLEVKNNSIKLIKPVVEKIAKGNLWDRVYITGFTPLLKNALCLRKEFPKLKVMRFITIPIYTYLKKPRPCYGVILGWLDGIIGSRRFFKICNSKKHLVRLRKFYEKNNIKVMAGVINNPDDFKFFKEIGIRDMVTDKVPEAVPYFSSQAAS